MFSQALKGRAAALRALPRCNAVTGRNGVVLTRKVTTDAASAHTDKENVPAVRLSSVLAIAFTNCRGILAISERRHANSVG